jgi:hypothetical protein
MGIAVTISVPLIINFDVLNYVYYYWILGVPGFP